MQVVCIHVGTDVSKASVATRRNMRGFADDTSSNVTVGQNLTFDSFSLSLSAYARYERGRESLSESLFLICIYAENGCTLRGVFLSHNNNPHCPKRCYCFLGDRNTPRRLQPFLGCSKSTRVHLKGCYCF